jgi:Ca-activated chloride channel family protein
MAAPWLYGRLVNSITFTTALLVCTSPAVPPANAQFASGVSVVEVYATVTDEKGEPVTGLTVGDFQLFEDSAPQTISTFAAGDFPLNAAVALDRSFSVAGERLEAIKRAAHMFIDAIRPEDRLLIVKIGTTFEVADARAAQHARIDEVDAWGTTALHDSIIESIDAVEGAREARGRRALLIFSDGADRYSRASAADVTARARRSNVIVYPIAIGRDRPALFAELAAITGGRSVYARDGRGLPEAVKSIARELRYQYLLGYSPTRPLSAGSGEWRSIQVKVNRSRVMVRARDGYVP